MEKQANLVLQWQIFGLTRKVGLLVMLMVMAMLLIWAMDQSTVTSFIQPWRLQESREFRLARLRSHLIGAVNVAAAPPEIFQPAPAKSHAPEISEWVATDELEPNFSVNLVGRWLAPGGSPCKDSQTAGISLPALDKNSSAISLSTGDAHEFVFQATDENGNPRCLGGDYFEIDLSGERWKSRPPMKDHGNGNYSFTLQVHPDFVGEYNLTIILLFRHYEGLKFSPTRFAIDKQLRRIPISFTRPGSELPPLQTCKGSDFNRTLWSGRWTRHAFNDSCPISDDGRFRCQSGDFPCPEPWCSGSLGSIESNGWVYSAHCGFKLFSNKEAWESLNKKWLLWWGDSNHVDTVRNLLFFLLGVPDLEMVTRRFDKNFTNPANQSQSIRITNIFNGHWDDKGNYEGLNSLSDPDYRTLIRSYFNGTTSPDIIIFNSGLHDGVKWPTLRRFVASADFAASYWAELVGSAPVRPKFVFRSTVAVGGYARTLAFNPNKIEAFNGVLLDKLQQKGLVDAIVDDFDMTWAWHFDNRCNDGVHYGRFPAKRRWRDGGIGHQYFVDLMLGHVLLNALSARDQSG